MVKASWLNLPDNVATLYLEVVTSEDELNEAIDGSTEWLAEHAVKIDEATTEKKISRRVNASGK
jgi:hypothetical protein